MKTDETNPAADTKTPVNRHFYFGACPQCGQQDGYLNYGRSHWAVCDNHETKWWIGANLFSGWREEDQAIWIENAAKLESYTEVEPLAISHE